MAGRGGTRDGAVNRSMEVDVIESENAGVQSPLNPSSHTHSRGLSESQNLLPNSPKNLFHYSSTKQINFGAPSELAYDPGAPIPGRESPAWSGIPKTLARSRKERWRDLTTDVLSMCAGLPFFALAGVLIWVDGEQVEQHKENVLNECIKGASTLFPLVFSIIVGRAMIKLASWKLEIGASIGLLERLMGSRTVGGTIITQFRLRSFTAVGIGLVLLWLLSPVGGQAILRVLSTNASPADVSTNITFMNLRQQSYSGSSTFNSWFSGFSAMFNSALLATAIVKNNSMDSWGNVKIPMFSSLSNMSQDDNGWRQIPQNSSAPIYSSLFGLPIDGLSQGSTTLNVESSYLELKCSNITTNTTRGTSYFVNPGLISQTGPFYSSQNITSTTPWAMGYLGDDVTSSLSNSSILSLDNYPGNKSTQNYFSGIFLYQDFSGSQNVTSVYCEPSQSYVESKILCSKSSASSPPSCAVIAQRKSLLSHVTSNLTPLSLLPIFIGMTSLLPRISPEQNSISMLQNYLINPSSPTYIQSTPYASTQNSESRLLSVSPEDFGTRMGQIMNAFIQGSMIHSPSYLSSESKLPISSLSSTPSELSSQITSLSPSLTVLATTTISTPHFAVSLPWLILFLLCTLILPLSSLASAILSRRTIARDYLPYVSSLCRESEYVSFPTGGVGLNGMERSRMMKDMRIKLGDVGDLEAGLEIGTGVALRVGKLAIGQVGKGREVGTRGLDRRKLYV